MQALVGAGVVVAVGLASRRFPLGVALWDKSLGDALYAVMIYLLVAAARPRSTPARLGVAALALSVAIELFQLTGIPAGLPRGLRFVLGTTFAWHDMACYAVGVAAITAAHTAAASSTVRAGAR